MYHFRDNKDGNQCIDVWKIILENNYCNFLLHEDFLNVKILGFCLFEVKGGGVTKALKPEKTATILRHHQQVSCGMMFELAENLSFLNLS